MLNNSGDSFLDLQNDAPDPKKGFGGRILWQAAIAAAIIGGLILIALVAMSIVSIVGRKLFSTPIQGDIELVQMGVAFAAAAFLPVCEMSDHHIKVDAFTNWLGEGAIRTLDAIAHTLLTGMFVLLSWRTLVAALNTRNSGEVSTLLSVPMWVPEILLVPSLSLATVCGAYQVARIFRGEKALA